jgi:hypothetical protein
MHARTLFTARRKAWVREHRRRAATPAPARINLGDLVLAVEATRDAERRLREAVVAAVFESATVLRAASDLRATYEHRWALRHTYQAQNAVET